MKELGDNPKMAAKVAFGAFWNTFAALEKSAWSN
jgi:hypothetical protein